MTARRHFGGQRHARHLTTHSVPRLASRAKAAAADIDALATGPDGVMPGTTEFRQRAAGMITRHMRSTLVVRGATTRGEKAKR